MSHVEPRIERSLIACGLIAATRKLVAKITAKIVPVEVPVAFKKYFNPIHTTETAKISTANRTANVSKLSKRDSSRRSTPQKHQQVMINGVRSLGEVHHSSL
jgi:hypothetical protein